MDPDLKILLETVENQLNAAGCDLDKWRELRNELHKRLVKSHFPKPGDKIYAKYFQHQFFPATIDSFDPSNQKFHITWDDGDPQGRVVSVADVALNRVPGVSEIGVGSNVLFEQGSYGASSDVTGGTRWHMGKITNMTRQPDDSYLYDGEHVFGEQHGKWVTYRGYSREFKGLKLEHLRVSPNILDSFNAGPGQSNLHVPDVDVFVCFADGNTRNNNSKNINPMRIIGDIEEKLGVKTNLKVRNPSLAQISVMIQKAKVFLAFISNEFANDEKCQQQFQFAKKSGRIPVIPIVVGQGFDWTRSVVGLLIAGELYIHFKEESVYDQKVQELTKSIQRSLNASQNSDAPKKKKKGPKCGGFISYCWLNSLSSKLANEVGFVKGSEFTDPRKIKKDIETALGAKLWLDIEQLGTSNQGELNSSMFEQIAQGLANTKVVLSFISSEYSKSENCNMEFNHAVKTMKLPTVPIIVGEPDSEEWARMQVGMVLGQIEARDEFSERIDLRKVSSVEEYEAKVNEIAQRIADMVKVENEELEEQEVEQETPVISSRAPKIGDHVIAHWNGGQFFFSTIVSFDKDSMCFTVDWDDGDTTGRVVKYNEVAKDVEVEESDVGEGTKVLFPQGQYKLDTNDESYSGFRYFEGEVTSIKEVGGKRLYSGHHVRYEEGEVPRFRGVQYHFSDYELSTLRLAPSAFDVLCS